MKWWCSFLHGLDWLRHDSAKPQAADLHAPFALVDFRRNAMGMKIFLRIWFQNQRFSVFSDHKTNVGWRPD